uniref:Secreted protein n=1 Tax=Chromera velia CCMP2878 TaxID=1169474 RepID=A0A0G4I1X8_9ALVE|eukprot:Cvel_10263.t1-p1 / transcript=Cvel_10263.t1 / gene=Cvel_10263 / organism=Chromera_velia_CCMP2878 / gene_product=hypothetical protein / transcript_product=hypothetical protein / location=Cvel_scaffold615:41691-42080(+) / protein_length=130 / sequence_SO=supercontig / SO=protein_coding / is_pseudo=false
MFTYCGSVTLSTVAALAAVLANSAPSAFYTDRTPSSMNTDLGPPALFAHPPNTVMLTNPPSSAFFAVVLSPAVRTSTCLHSRVQLKARLICGTKFLLRLFSVFALEGRRVAENRQRPDFCGMNPSFRDPP